MVGLSTSHLYGLVDMGSNGIRFSISDLSAPSARSLPTVFQDRAGISLYDAQYSTGERGPIPQAVIDEVLFALSRFKIACADFGVPDTNIRVLATEATRTAVNSEDYRQQIQKATGWEVDMLPKESEGRIGAMGVASSFSSVEGLVMDLGGGSTQITWMIAKDGEVKTSPKGSFSFPYGAAAMSRRLAEVVAQGPEAEVALAKEMKANFLQAVRDLDIPATMQANAEANGGFQLYLSGGGFRGWGYLLMNQHRVIPYPIPIINGFHVTKREFERISEVRAAAESSEVFRVSKRRADQVPAVAFLVNVLMETLPDIKEIRFCQGGVREGFLFDALDTETRALDPLISATARYASPSSAELAELLVAAIPYENKLGRIIPSAFEPRVIRAVADLLFTQSSLPKETRSLAALYAPITGILASAHGISHLDRSVMALILHHRCDGELAPPHDAQLERIRAILTRQEVFWCSYVGKIASLVGDVYPAGRVGKEKRLGFKAQWTSGLGKKGLEEGVALTVYTRSHDPMTVSNVLHPAVQAIEAVGKKKNRVGGRDGFGVPVDISVESSLP